MMIAQQVQTTLYSALLGVLQAYRECLFTTLSLTDGIAARRGQRKKKKSIASSALERIRLDITSWLLLVYVYGEGVTDERGRQE